MNSNTILPGTYRNVIAKFVREVRRLGVPCATVILDGSCNTGEAITRLSDIDIKLFLSPGVDVGAVRAALVDATRNAIGAREVTFNLWTLLDEEFPLAYPLGTFDFVRRHVLKHGTVLLGDDRRANIALPEVISQLEATCCLQQTATFAIRLRRLLTNPSAVSDVVQLRPSFLLQQAVAYFFHSARYYGAFHGAVARSIGETAAIYSRCEGISVDERDLIRRLLRTRQAWHRSQKCRLPEARMVLVDVVDAIGRMLRRLSKRCPETGTGIRYT